VLCTRLKIRVDAGRSSHFEEVTVPQVVITVVPNNDTCRKQSPKDHPQDNTGILHIPYDTVTMIVPLHPNCNRIKWEITHVNIQEFITSYPPRKEPDQSDRYTSEIAN
jgi:hypothetical protein